MCYWVGTQKLREAFLKRRQEFQNDEIAKLFYHTFIDPIAPDVSTNLQEHAVAVGKAKPLLTALVKVDQELAFKNMEWTMQWNYFDRKTNAEKSGRPLLNVTSENVFWQHKDRIHSQRCIVPIDGYWEFYHFKGKTYPHFIQSSKDELFYAGGIYNRLLDTETGEIADTLALITTEPNELASKLHNNPKAPNGSRMLMLLDYENVEEFLNPELTKFDLKNRFLKPYADDKMKAHPTVRFLKKEFAEYARSEKVQFPFEYPELAS